MAVVDGPRGDQALIAKWRLTGGVWPGAPVYELLGQQFSACTDLGGAGAEMQSRCPSPGGDRAWPGPPARLRARFLSLHHEPGAGGPVMGPVSAQLQMRLSALGSKVGRMGSLAFCSVTFAALALRGCGQITPGG